jgi:hypothetical protein
MHHQTPQARQGSATPSKKREKKEKKRSDRVPVNDVVGITDAMPTTDGEK